MKLETKTIEKWIKTLIASGELFVQDYREVCLKHKIMVDAGCGSAVVATANDREIEEHCQKLSKSVKDEIHSYKNIVEPVKKSRKTFNPHFEN